MRRDATWTLVTRSLAGTMRLVNDDAPPHFGGAGVAAAHITSQTALLLGAALQDHRPLRLREANAFRALGDLALRGELSEEEAVDALEAGMEQVLAAVRCRARSAPFSERTRAAVVKELEAEAASFVAEAAKELRVGVSGQARGNEDRAGMLLRLLDGNVPDDELGAAASRVGLDASREYGVVLLVHTLGSTHQMEGAAQDVEVAIPDAVDLGLTDTQPISRRVVFPVLTHGRWIEARTTLHDIATRYRLLAIAPIAAPRLGALAETARAVELDLARVVAGCGYTSGIIDPAHVGRECPAEGTSPAPAAEWPAEAALTAAVA